MAGQAEKYTRRYTKMEKIVSIMIPVVVIILIIFITGFF